MRGSTHWHYHPYSRLNQAVPYPYICQIQPVACGFDLALIDPQGQGPYELSLVKYQSLSAPKKIEFRGDRLSVRELEDEQDYSLIIKRLSDGQVGNQRLVRTGQAPGRVINYLHPLDEQYAFSGRSLCSPSIAVLPSGRYLASMDVFAGGAPQNLSLLFYSDDKGDSWHYLNDLFPCFWGKLFTHRGALYMLAHATEYGDLLIGRSDDEGHSWSRPVHILPGSGSALDAGPHKAPMPVIEHGGRLFTGLDYGAWRLGGHASAVLSIDSDADLLDPAQWESTPFLPYDPSWPGAAKGNCGGLLEGNVLVAPDGGIVNMLRYNMKGAAPEYGRAAILRMSDPFGSPQAPLAFDAIVSFNGGSNSKFLTLRDPVSDQYIALASEVTDPSRPAARNVLSLCVSSDLHTWRTVYRLIDYRQADSRYVGFQYPDMLIEGEDLLCLSRTSFNRAKNFHDANYITFHRIKNFRRLLTALGLTDSLPGT